MTAARTSHPRATGDAVLWLCALLAILLHGLLLFAWKYAPEENASSIMEGDSMEVALVESAPAAALPAAEPAPPTPAATPPEPDPVPPPEPPKNEPEIVLPPPPKPTPPPRLASTATPSPRMTPKPATAKGTSSSRIFSAGSSAGASASASTAAGSAGTGRSAKVTYLVRPQAAYPPESRAAGEQGIVILRLVVDGSGRPAAVSIGKSSGHPRLDRAAVEAGWRCRVRDAVAGSHLDAPVRFNLSD